MMCLQKPRHYCKCSLFHFTIEEFKNIKNNEKLLLKINTKTCVELIKNLYCSIENCPYMYKIKYGNICNNECNNECKCSRTHLSDCDNYIQSINNYINKSRREIVNLLYILEKYTIDELTNYFNIFPMLSSVEIKTLLTYTLTTSNKKMLTILRNNKLLTFFKYRLKYINEHELYEHIKNMLTFKSHTLVPEQVFEQVPEQEQDPDIKILDYLSDILKFALSNRDYSSYYFDIYQVKLNEYLSLHLNLSNSVENIVLMIYYIEKAKRLISENKSNTSKIIENLSKELFIIE